MGKRFNPFQSSPAEAGVAMQSLSRDMPGFNPRPPKRALR